MRLGLNGFGVGVVVFIAAYVASIVLYVNSGVAHPHQVAESPPSSAGTTVTVDTEDIQSNDGETPSVRRWTRWRTHR